MSLESPEEGSEGNCKFNSGKAVQARESRLERNPVLVGEQAIGVFAPDNPPSENRAMTDGVHMNPTAWRTDEKGWQGQGQTRSPLVTYLRTKKSVSKI